MYELVVGAGACGAVNVRHWGGVGVMRSWYSGTGRWFY
jgi:hypothetical protein